MMEASVIAQDETVTNFWKNDKDDLEADAALLEFMELKPSKKKHYVRMQGRSKSTKIPIESFTQRQTEQPSQAKVNNYEDYIMEGESTLQSARTNRNYVQSIHKGSANLDDYSGSGSMMTVPNRNHVFDTITASTHMMQDRVFVNGRKPSFNAGLLQPNSPGLKIFVSSPSRVRMGEMVMNSNINHNNISQNGGPESQRGLAMARHSSTKLSLISLNRVPEHEMQGYDPVIAPSPNKYASINFLQSPAIKGGQVQSTWDDLSTKNSSSAYKDSNPGFSDYGSIKSNNNMYSRNLGEDTPNAGGHMTQHSPLMIPRTEKRMGSLVMLPNIKQKSPLIDGSSSKMSPEIKVSNSPLIKQMRLPMDIMPGMDAKRNYQQQPGYTPTYTENHQYRKTLANQLKDFL